VLRADAQLTRDTWYEVYVLAKSKRAGIADGRLPGVSFRTSRWADGPEMMPGLHFPLNGVGSAQGGVALPAGAILSPRTSLDDDGAFDAFLDALGLDGWPAPDTPRASLLWHPPVPPDTAWRCAGLLLESPEPIHRPGRFEVADLQLSMGPGSALFDVRLRDRSASRLLFATSTAFVPHRTRRVPGLPSVSPRLRLTCTDRPVGQPAQTLQGWLELPLQPSFAEEAS
jgi:hypothetical protein